MARKARISPEEKERKKRRLKADFYQRKRDHQQSAIRDIEVFSMHDKAIGITEAYALWSVDKQNTALYLQNFVNYNRESLAFLGIEYALSTTNIELVLRASQLVGCAPLISPVTGKQCGNIIVKSEYQEDLYGIIPLIEGDIEIDYCNHLPLNKSPFVHPPIYLECIRFVEEFNKLDKTKWKKFTNFTKIQNLPSSSTDWGKYAIQASDPTMRLKYPNRINRLVTDHDEWMELMYVLSLAIKEIQNSSTPGSVRQNYFNSILQLKQIIPYNKLSPVKELKIRRNDYADIKNIKAIGNHILKNESTTACAWTFNITKLYERYVQYIFGKVMQKLGGNIHCNMKFPISGQLPAWSLRYLEPDIILKFGEQEVIVDAKYKSHMMNLHSNTDNLRQSFREDIHQVLAYSSFSQTKTKQILFCYPSPSLVHKTMDIRASHNGAHTQIYLLGLPINRNLTEVSINYVYELLKH